MKTLLGSVALAALVAVAGPALAQTQSSPNAVTSGMQGGRDGNVSKSGEARTMMQQNSVAPGQNRTGNVSTSRTDGNPAGANMRSKVSPEEARGQAASPTGGAVGSSAVTTGPSTRAAGDPGMNSSRSGAAASSGISSTDSAMSSSGQSSQPTTKKKRTARHKGMSSTSASAGAGASDTGMRSGRKGRGGSDPETAQVEQLNRQELSRMR